MKLQNEVAWAIRMFPHQKSVREFNFALHAIQPIMTDPKETRGVKRMTLGMMVNELSEETFNLEPVAEQIMTIVNMKEEVCKEYTSTDEQVQGILEWLPRMSKYRDMLFKEVKRHRQECGLSL